MKHLYKPMAEKGSYTLANKTLALFDFDGTITKKDTFLEFIKYTCGRAKFWRGMLFLSPLLVLYILKIIPNHKAKATVISHFFKNWNYGKFKLAGKEFCEKKLPSLLKKSAVDKIAYHQRKEHRVILVTASIKEWVAPWCEENGIEIIATELEVIDHKVTGNLGTPNCYGPEKVKRLKAALYIEDYSTIYAYGDSAGDREMLALAQKPYYQHFDD